MEKHSSDKEEEEKEREETPPRRITRRLSCSALNNPSESQTETRRRQRSESGPRSLQTTRKTRSESVTSDSSGGSHPTPRPGLRHSARLSSHGSTAPPEITKEISLPIRERKKSEPDSDSKTHLKEKRDRHEKQTLKEKANPGQGHKDKALHKGSEDNKENVKQTNSDQGSSADSSKGTYSSKLMADDANYDGRTPPVKIYGAQHLLRLFGEFNISDPIMKVLSAVYNQFM